MFYLREELDKLKEENESLKSRLDDLTKVSMESKSNSYDELIAAVTEAVKNAAENFFNVSHKNVDSDSSDKTSQETER